MRKVLWIIFIILVSFAVYDSRPRASMVHEESVSTASSTATTSMPVASSVSSSESGVTVSTYPASVEQGDPVLIEVSGLSSTTTVSSMKLGETALGVSNASGTAEALAGIDLRGRTGTYPISITLSSGRVIKSSLKVGARYIAKAPLGIPESLGGNSTSSQQTLVNSLVDEAKVINAIKTSSEKLWSGAFRFPLNGEIVVTDPYGYSRETGSTEISHKGTDFHAATGTPVYAMNSGRVAYTGFMRDYGNTVALDHGLGLLTIYMHLSEIDVVKGQMVEKGALIAKSGDTGYVLGPHLHVTVRINNISIDPMKFMSLLGTK